MAFLSRDAALSHARRLGLTVGKATLACDVNELVLAIDLAIHTAPADRSRAIDRYARSARLALGTDEARMLDAMCNARFAVFRVERRHPTVGLIVTDLVRESELWLVDEGFEESLPAEFGFATRYYLADQFIMMSDIFLPVGRTLLTEAIESVRLLKRKSPVGIIEDRRFAEALYRAVLADGIMEEMAYEDSEEAA